MPDRHLVNGSHPIPQIFIFSPMVHTDFLHDRHPSLLMHFLNFLSFPSFEHGSFITGLTFCLRPKLGSLALARTGGMDLLGQAVQIASGNTVNVPQAFSSGICYWKSRRFPHPARTYIEMYTNKRDAFARRIYRDLVPSPSFSRDPGQSPLSWLPWNSGWINKIRDYVFADSWQVCSYRTRIFQKCGGGK